jgi:hypothetical protein
MTVALWFWRFHSITYDIYDSESGAADAAVYLEEYESGVPIGIQFSDGRTVRVEDWPEYVEADARREARIEAKRAVTPPCPTRRVLDPFEGQSVVVDGDDPSWLGKITSNE